MKRTNYCANFNIENIGENVIVQGWISKSRDLGSLLFCDVRDRTGIVQTVFDESFSKELKEKASALRSEFVVEIEGKIRKRDGNINPNIPTGEIEILAERLEIFNTSKTPPFYITDDLNCDESLRLKNRFLDLRRPKMQNILRMRSNLYRVTRNYFYDENFLEVETPMMTRSTPEGARDYVVPSRIFPGSVYALPQSPQLFKQLLMVAGTDRYFQLARCFRDEDLRADRQPEFTQIDLEASFISQDEILEIMEGLMKKIAEEVFQVKIADKFPRITYQQALEDYGRDCPDLRYDMKIENVTEGFLNCDFEKVTLAIKEGQTVKAINAKGMAETYSRKKCDQLAELSGQFGCKELYFVKLQKGEINSSIKKFLTEEMVSFLTEKCKLEEGDVLFLVCSKNLQASKALGQVRMKIASDNNLIPSGDHDLSKLKPEDLNLLWVVDFPLFEKNEEGRVVSNHHPFTCPKEEDLHLLEAYLENGNEESLLSARANAYDLVFNGNELGSGSIRIHSKEVQEQIFKVLGLTDEECQEKFGFLLRAFEYGAPPHGGMALGLDRILMKFLNNESIRDMIPFPKTLKAQCLLTNAPSVPDQKQLDDLHMKFHTTETEQVK